MNSLDELFGEALEREALTTTGERRSAIAEVTVFGARRRRRVRHTVQGLAVIAAVAVAVLVIPQLRGDDTVTPADPTPTPTSSVAVVPNVEYADDRLPQAPVMTPSDWNTKTGWWDAELVSYQTGGKDAIGPVVAIYLTPRGGERMLAWANDNSDLGAPILLGFDEQTRSVMLSNGPSSNAVRVLNLLTGVLTEAPLNLSEPISGWAPLGRLSNGDSVFVVSTVDSKSDHTQHVLRMFDDTAVPVTEGRFAVSPLWNDRMVVINGGQFTFLDADGTPPPSIDGAEGCAFGAWNTDGTFVTICGATETRFGSYLRIDPASGTRTTLWEGADLDSGTEGPASLTERHAVDQVRAWSGVGIGAFPAAASQPPIVYEDGVEVADLAQGFGEAPDGYGIIFGP